MIDKIKIYVVTVRNLWSLGTLLMLLEYAIHVFDVQGTCSESTPACG
jgi:hypothetical protein